MTAQHAAPDSWAGINKDVVKEIVRQAELQLQQQAPTAQSYDQRGTSVASLTIGGAVAVVAFAGTQAVTNENGLPAAVAWGTVVLAALWFASACCAFRTIRPGDWLSAGTWPHQWYSLVREDLTEAELLGATAEQLEGNCATNQLRNDT